MNATIEIRFKKNVQHSKHAQLSSTNIKSVAMIARRMKASQALRLTICGNLCELVSLVAVAVPCL